MTPDRYQQSTTLRLDEVERRTAVQQEMLAVGAERMDRFEAALKANTELTQQVHKDTAELVAWVKAIQGATRVLEAIGKLAKPVGYILLAVGITAGWWASVKGLLSFSDAPKPPHKP